MSNPADDQPDSAEPIGANYPDYGSFLAAVRKYRRMRLIDISQASIHPAFPDVYAKHSALSQMESGSYTDPTFRQIILLARGYGVSLDDLAPFFYGPGPNRHRRKGSK